MSEGSASAEVEGSGSASEELGEVADEELEEESEDAEHDEVRGLFRNFLHGVVVLCWPDFFTEQETVKNTLGNWVCKP